MADNSAFISYRRQVAYPWARLVWDGLRDRGIDTFFDLESMRTAGRFDQRLLNQIGARPYFVPILTEGTLERCVDPEDWLRREIEHAIDTDRIIVPLFVAPFAPGEFPVSTPPHIAEALGESNGLTIYSDYLVAALDQLARDRLVPVDLSLATLTDDDAQFQSEVEEKVQSLPPPTVPITPTAVPPEVTIKPVDSEPVVLGAGGGRAGDGRDVTGPAEPPATDVPATVPLATMPPPSIEPAPSGDDSRNRRIAVVFGAAAAVIALFIVIGIVAGGGGDDDDDPPVATGADTTLTEQQPPTTPTEDETGSQADTTPAPPDECDGFLSLACTREGDTRDDVRELQTLLNRTEFGPTGGLAEDGQFGPNTNAALGAFLDRCSTCGPGPGIEVDGPAWNTLEAWAAMEIDAGERAAVDALRERWVIQVGAYGTCRGGELNPAGDLATHADFGVQLAAFGGVVLANGDELNLGTNNGSGCFFSFLPVTFDTADDAQAFCDVDLKQDLGVDCIRKFVSADSSINVGEGP